MTTILDRTIPFRFLTEAQRSSLAESLAEHRLRRGDVVIRQGDADDDRVFLIDSGSVNIYVDGERLGGGWISEGHYFGERSALFSEPRHCDIRAAEDSVVFSMTGQQFLSLLAESKVFAQAFSDILRVKQGIFAGFDAFLAEMHRGVARHDLALRRLLPLYKKLDPALHRLASEPDRIDFEALAYAVRRLPDNVTRSFVFFVTDALTDIYGNPDDWFEPIESGGRRRAVYEMVPGKNLVFIRDGLTDLTDLVTNLCLYSIEAKKIRKRLDRKDVLSVLVSGTEDPVAIAEQLPLTSEEAQQLAALWPEDTVERLQEIVLHHEDFALHVDKRLDNYNDAHSERWIEQVAGATRQLCGFDPTAMPPEWSVHVISSNTHSVTNCLSAYLSEHIGDILDWGRSTESSLVQEPWQNDLDLVYALSRDYFAAHPEDYSRRRVQDREAGIMRLSETAFTGIGVELIDASTPLGAIDSGVTTRRDGPPRLIVNIDYAFGQQAEEIIGGLLSLFSRNLASVNVLGKAGALVGRRGDILVPTRFVEQQRDAVYAVPELSSSSLEQLRHRAGGIDVHVGPVLTVTGTLLQNPQMLHFYRKIWQCIGLEMEGSFYHRKILEAINVGVLPDDVELRYMYYVSDLPLMHDSNLTGRMSMREGVPPLYAITRQMLSEILS